MVLYRHTVESFIFVGVYFLGLVETEMFVDKWEFVVGFNGVSCYVCLSLCFKLCGFDWTNENHEIWFSTNRNEFTEFYLLSQ